MLELSLAIVKDFNVWFAACIIGIAASIAAARINKRWAIAEEAKNTQEHKLKMYELATERTVKTERLSSHPVEHAGPKLDHRMSDGE